MARDLPTGMATAAAATVARPVFIVQLDWPSGTVRAWTGYGDLSWNSQTWLGTGHLGSIADIRESLDGSANGLTLTLSGIPTTEVFRALEEDAQGRPGKVWLALLDGAGALVTDPYLIFDGVIDVSVLEDSGETATISLQLEKELVDTRTRGRRYTHEDQQMDYPTDRGFEYVAGLAEKEILWGTAKVPAAPAPEPEYGFPSDIT